jgi:hypothetical protein
MVQLGWILIATGMVTRTDSQLTIPGGMAFSFSRGSRSSNRRFQTRYSGPPDETNDPPDEKVIAPEQGICGLVTSWTKEYWGLVAPLLGLRVPQIGQMSALDQCRALKQFLNFVQFLK